MGKKKKNKNVDMFAFNAGTSKTDKNKKTRKSKKDKKRPLDRAFDKTILQMTGEEFSAFIEYLYEKITPEPTDLTMMQAMHALLSMTEAEKLRRMAIPEVDTNVAEVAN